MDRSEYVERVEVIAMVHAMGEPLDPKSEGLLTKFEQEVEAYEKENGIVYTPPVSEMH